jgi:hypothetical protein
MTNSSVTESVFCYDVKQNPISNSQFRVPNYNLSHLISNIKYQIDFRQPQKYSFISVDPDKSGRGDVWV